ncbi:MAG: DUF2500 domain-containing protein [Ruminococcaceae bacterium]|nr:DUF2500 domain-containing protein [Oscillospiraceae bacterium]
MMGNAIGFIINIVFWLLGLAIVTLILLRFICQQSRKTVTNKATVVDKQKYVKETLSKSQAPKTETLYTVTFLCNGKELTFYTGAETYEACHIKQKGLLTYKGLQFVDFTTKQKEQA